ncbi:MAG: DUF1549 and DUF1553 domain-containing protein [Gemmataceae bacterium]|nr:DUF1549 and DUF1553 domain-containing protein [Gemmataceae bacterium]
MTRRTWLPACLALLLLTGPARAQPAPDFETQVVPVLTRAGCNSGSCHGAAIGRGGLRLSLLGYDPALDYDSLIHEFEGRRVNLARPEKSLVLRKPAGRLAHEGGVKLPASGDGFQVVLDWIRAGAPRASRRTLLALEVMPRQQRLANTGQSFRLKVTARFSGGAVEDVTRWALLTPADSAALRCSPAGDVTALRRGRHNLMVRFLGEVSAATVTVPLHPDPPARADYPRANFIDEHVNRTLAELHLPAARRADDETFLRRVYLDLIGTLPDPEEVKTFLADRADNRRARLVERLLERPEFIDRWAYWWGDVLRIESKRLGREGAAAFHGWVREQVRANTPLDKMVQALLLTTGDSYREGAANFSRVPASAGAHAEHVSQVFLGVRLQCANCHNHPLDRWTQDDYHGLAAVFARVGRGREVTLLTRGEVIHPRTGQPAQPRIPGGARMAADAEPRAELGRWLTGRANPYVARATVNRVWRELMGRGLVEPVDDHRATNPPTHPDLLDALARDFAERGFDLRRLIRTITASEAYQRSSLGSAANKNDDRFYSRALVRPLSPVVLVDAVAKVTGVPEKLGALPEGARALALGDTRVPSTALDLLGRCSREDGCTPGQDGGGGLALALHTINGPWLNAKIAHPKGRLHQLLADGKPNEEIVARLCETALGRSPSAAERAHWRQRLDGVKAAERAPALEDFLWALLNSAEFRSNH